MDPKSTQSPYSPEALAVAWQELLQSMKQDAWWYRFGPFVWFGIASMFFMVFYAFDTSSWMHMAGFVCWLAGVISWWRYRRNNPQHAWHAISRLPVKDQIPQVGEWIEANRKPGWLYVTGGVLASAMFAITQMENPAALREEFDGTLLLWSLLPALLLVLYAVYMDRRQYRRRMDLVREMLEAFGQTDNSREQHESKP